MVGPNKAILFNGLNPAVFRLVQTHRIDFKSFSRRVLLVFVLRINADDIGVFHPAWATPGSPKVDQNHFAAEVTQFHDIPVGILIRQFRGLIAHIDIGQLEGHIRAEARFGRRCRGPNKARNNKEGKECVFHDGCKLGRNAFNVGTEGSEALVNALVAAVNLFNVVDGAGSFGREGSNKQGDARSNIWRSHHRGSQGHLSV